jgi:ankyrin repeat protein
LVATIRGNFKVAQLLLERGADPNAPGPGYTPLHWAAGSWEATLTGANGSALGRDEDWRVLAGLRGEIKLDFIKALLAHGANPNARLVKDPPRFGYSQFNFIWKSANPLAPNMGPLDLSGATPFLLSAMSADVSVMRLLVEAGADPALSTKDDTTALMLAAGIGRVQEESFVSEDAALEAVKVALEFGNDIHAVNKRGQTPLHAAAFLRYNKVVQYLVDQGASVRTRNVRGQIPAVVAELTYGGSSEVVNRSATGDLLRKLGGE